MAIDKDKLYEFTATPDFEMYYSDQSSFGVYKFTTATELPELKSSENIISFGSDSPKTYSGILSGRMQRLYLGDEYVISAKLKFNKKYNSWQYEPVSIMAAAPKSLEQQKVFLQTILTEKQADKLISAYPNIVEDIMNGTDNVDFSLVKGIGQFTYNKIKEKVINNYVISDILITLQPLGITYNTIKKLSDDEPNPVLLKEQLLQNPYILTRIHGLGFKKVDDLALKINSDLRDSEKRLKSFLTYYLKETGESAGHTWIDKGVLETAVRDNVHECIDKYKELIESAKYDEENFLIISGRKIGLKHYYNTEKYIFDKLTAISREYEIKVDENDIINGISEAEEIQGFVLTEEQRNIVVESTKYNLIVLSGKAGTGKTSVSRAILNVYKNKCSIACCALSAKAAQRITEATGFEAFTIHRLLGCQGLGKFRFNEENPLDYDVIFVDEASMISSDIFFHLLRAVRNKSKLIICGDNRQLPPIGYGNTFNDILDISGGFGNFTLTKVLRQAEKSGILSDANMIREGSSPIKSPELKTVTGELKDMTYMFRDDRDMLNNIAIKSYMNVIKQSGIDQTIIGVPRKKDCVNSTSRINETIQELLLPDEERFIKYGSKKYKLGAKVIQKVNNYEKDVFNGEVGYIVDIRQETKGRQKINMFTVEYTLNGVAKQIDYTQNEAEQIDLAYAMTIHSLQGSGYKSVILIIDNTHFALLDNCLLYTALTRAKERCLLLAEPYAFKKCIDTNKVVARQTWFSDINHGCKIQS